VASPSETARLQEGHPADRPAEKAIVGRWHPVGEVLGTGRFLGRIVASPQYKQVENERDHLRRSSAGRGRAGGPRDVERHRWGW